jgi:hypothetical protein
MSKWSQTKASPHGQHPMPPGTQTWEIGLASPEPVIGLPTKAITELTEAQRQEEHIVKQLRELGEIRPGQSLPSVKGRR